MNIYYVPEAEEGLWMLHIGTLKVIIRGSEDQCKQHVDDLSKEMSRQLKEGVR